MNISARRVLVEKYLNKPHPKNIVSKKFPVENKPIVPDRLPETKNMLNKNNIQKISTSCLK